jgi:hypothetical protein
MSGINTVMRLQVPGKKRIFLTSSATFSFARKILVHGVSYFY